MGSVLKLFGPFVGFGVFCLIVYLALKATDVPALPRLICESETEISRCVLR